jgi:SPX domain protein involved in polyphosphate accumulation
VHEEVALAARDFVQSYLEIDGYGATLPNLSYPVHSLYLDSDDFRLYDQTINGNKNRYKLRARFYENSPDAPIYFEIKRRINNTIRKQRGSVSRESAKDVLQGFLPSSTEIAHDDPKQMLAFEEFLRHVNEIQAHPKVHVAYLREAWISTRDNSVRVTMDRQVRCGPETRLHFSTEMHNEVRPFGDRVILELKFTERYPNWFSDLVRALHIQQGSAAKYVDGLSLLGKETVQNSAYQPAWL